MNQEDFITYPTIPLRCVLRLYLQSFCIIANMSDPTSLTKSTKDVIFLFQLSIQIWGPSRVTSFDFNYFITFTDECSRYTWVYLMKERSELLSILMSFSKEVENQFGKTIKILRSDNAKEYFSSELNSYLSSKEILHQSTCPRTPQ
ncbi:hypothetical protein CR513_20691, partial [Mucuna pruriens]